MSTVMLITPELITRVGPLLLRYARRYMSAADAEDVVQATWASALDSASSFAGRSSAKTWLFAILWRRICDYRRRERRHEELSDEVVLPVAEAPERKDLSDARERVQSALARLTPAERAAVVMVDLEGLDRDRAAQRIDVTRGHLRVLLFRAREKLSSQLTAQGFTAELVNGARRGPPSPRRQAERSM